jgi:hypothetical protein
MPRCAARRLQPAAIDAKIPLKLMTRSAAIAGNCPAVEQIEGRNAGPQQYLIPETPIGGRETVECLGRARHRRRRRSRRRYVPAGHPPSHWSHEPAPPFRGVPEGEAPAQLLVVLPRDID